MIAAVALALLMGPAAEAEWVREHTIWNNALTSYQDCLGATLRKFSAPATLEDILSSGNIRCRQSERKLERIDNKMNLDMQHPQQSILHTLKWDFAERAAALVKQLTTNNDIELNLEFQSRLNDYAACYAGVLTRHQESGYCAVLYHSMIDCKIKYAAVGAVSDSMVLKGGESDWMVASQSKVLTNHLENVDRSFGFPPTRKGNGASCGK